MVRKSAASIAVPDSTFLIHAGSSPRAETSHPASVTKIAIPQARRGRRRDKSRKDFNLYLLRPDVVGNIFRGHGEFVWPWRSLLGDDQLSRVNAGARVPIQSNRRRAFQSCDQGARALRRARHQIYRLAAAISSGLKLDLNHGRLAGDYE